MPYTDPIAATAAKRRWEREHPEKKRAQDRRSYRRHRDVRRAQQQRYWALTKTARAEVARRWRLKRFGLTVADYNALLARQGYRCGICGSPTPRTKDGRNFAVDHCHTTGVVRGLLCGLCNTALGKFKDSRVVLRSAMAYLEKDAA